MDPALLARLADAPGGPDRLREVVVALGVRGRLDGAAPSGWARACLADVARYTNGAAIRARDRVTDGGLPVVRIQNLTDPSRPMHRVRGRFPDERLVRRGDLLVAWSGTLDAFAWDGELAVVNQHLFKVDPDPTRVRPRYLLHLLRDAMRGLSASRHAHGLVMKHVNRGPFLRWPVLLPPLSEQDRLADRIDALLARCDALAARRAAHDAAADALRTAAVAALLSGEPLPNAARRALVSGPPDALRDAVVALALQGRLGSPGVLTDTGGPWSLPRSWRWARLDALARLEIGRTPSTRDPSLWTRHGGLPFVAIGDLPAGGVVTDTRRRVTEAALRALNRRPTPAGTLLVSFKLTLGKAAVLGADAWHNEALVAVRPEDGVCRDWLLHALPPLFRRAPATAAVKGPTLNRRTLAALPVPVPPPSEQRRLTARIDALCGHIDRIAEASRAADDAGRALVEATSRHVRLAGAAESGQTPCTTPRIP